MGLRGEEVPGSASLLLVRPGDWQEGRAGSWWPGHSQGTSQMGAPKCLPVPPCMLRERGMKQRVESAGQSRSETGTGEASPGTSLSPVPAS